jgi:ABC-type multidrug transport system ATPase subunit
MKLVIRNVSKTYSNGVKALQNINLDIPQGMFGLVGPNGAGKSSLMRTIATLQEADQGSIQFGDIDVFQNVNALRMTLGYLPQEFGVYPRISAEDMLMHLAELKGISSKSQRKEQVEQLLHKTNLWDARKRRLGTYSGGMRQRFGIAQALLGSPTLIIVDEPTAGLDPTERNRFHNLLCEIGEEVVVILSTHIIEDVQSLCQHVAFIHQGQVMQTGTPDELVNTIKGKIWCRTVERNQTADYSHLNIISSHLKAGKIDLYVMADNQPDSGFVAVEPKLENVYFALNRSGANQETV